MANGLAKVESHSDSQERRATVRIVPNPEYELRIELNCKAGGVIRGEVADMSNNGVGVNFPRDAKPAVALGERATLLFTATILKRPVEVVAELVSRTETNSSRRYAFKFAEELVLTDPKMHRLFNRRGAYRVSLGREETIEVGFRAPGSENSQKLSAAKCLDISASGIALETDIGTDKAFSDVDVVEVSLKIPDATTTQTILAWIVYRKIENSGAMRYGLRFDDKQTKNFSAQQDAITTYVLRRQQEELQDLSHIKPGGIQVGGGQAHS